jgi:cyclophilin family peptidyl-prolyl cis-trans isomerase
MNFPLSRKLHVTLLAATLGLTTFLTACGGGGSSAAEVRVASVGTIMADSAPTYDNLATFSVAGANLDVGVTASAAGCAGPVILSGGTATAVKVTCTPSRDGEISVSLSATGGALLKTATFVVPKPQVKMTTSLGSLLIELEPAKAPITVKNFLAYVQDGFYANTVFHRIDNTFVAQGGGFTFPGTTYTFKTPTRLAIPLEKTSATGLSNKLNTIAMARTNVADSATSQFFINLVDNAHRLDAQTTNDGNGYAVFGTVVTTPDVNSAVTLTAIKAVQVRMNSFGEPSEPLNPPLISAVSRIR